MSPRALSTSREALCCASGAIGPVRVRLIDLADQGALVVALAPLTCPAGSPRSGPLRLGEGQTTDGTSEQLLEDVKHLQLLFLGK